VGLMLLSCWRTASLTFMRSGMTILPIYSD
jgi:hypothetical protein